MHVGFSDNHPNNAPLVLNPSTGSITSQWNTVFDDYFSTVSTTETKLPDFTDESWSKMFGTTTCHFPIPSSGEEIFGLEEPDLEEKAPMFPVKSEHSA